MNCNHALAFSEKKWEMKCGFCNRVWGFTEIKEALDLLDRQVTSADAIRVVEDNQTVIFKALAEMEKKLDEVSKMQVRILKGQVQKDRNVRSVY